LPRVRRRERVARAGDREQARELRAGLRTLAGRAAQGAAAGGRAAREDRHRERVERLPALAARGRALRRRTRGSAGIWTAATS
jgi:hypothetical protein